MQQIGLEAIFKDSGFQAGIKKYNQGIEQATQATEKGASAMSRLGNVAGGALKVGLAGLTVGVGVAVTAMGALTSAAKIGLDTTLAWGEQLGDLGDMFGMTGEKASSFAYLSNKVGLSVDEMGMGLNTFTRNLADMAETMKDPKAKPTAFAESLKKLGVTAVKSNGQLKTFDEILPELMDAFSDLPAGVKATDLAMQLFGTRGGSKFLDFLRQGSKGLEDARKKAKAFGLELSQKDTDAVEDFSFAMNELRLKLKGIWNVIGMQVLPIARRLVDFISNEILPALVPIVQEWAPKFADVIGRLGDGFGRLLAGFQTGNFANFAVWLDQTFGRQRANDIMGIVLAIDNFITTVKKKGWGEAFKGLATGFWDWLTGKGGVISQIGTKAGELITAFTKWATSDATKEGLKTTSKNIVTGIIDGIKALFGLPATTNPAVEPMPESLKESVYAFWDAFKAVGEAIAEGIKEGIAEQIASINWGKVIADAIWTSLKGGAALTTGGTFKSPVQQFLDDFLKGDRSREVGTKVGTDLMTGIREGTQQQTPSTLDTLRVPYQQFGDWLRNTFTPQSQQDGQNLGIVTGGAVSGGVWAQAPNILRGLQSPLSNFRGWLTGSSWLYSLGSWAGSSFGSGLQFSVQAYVNSVMARFQTAMNAVRNMFKGGAAMSFAEGGWVPRTGQAMVHAGEYVINRQQALAMAPVLAGANNSRTYNFVNNWHGTPASFDTRQVERIAEQAAYRGIREAMGAT